jgi:hypothetical protein
MKLLVTLVLVVCIHAQTLQAKTRKMSWGPPQMKYPAQSFPVHHAVPSVTTLQVAHLRIHLEESSLAAVAKYFHTPIGHKGDASESLSWLCVSGKDQSGPWLLWLGSDEMGGGNIDWFQLRKIGRNMVPNPRCHQLTKSKTPQTFPIPLHLGMTRQQVRQTLGQLNWTASRYLLFERDRNLKLHGEPYTETSSVNIEFSKGRTVAIQVIKTTSN